MSGRGCGGPGPVVLLAVPWGWDVMQGAGVRGHRGPRCCLEPQGDELGGTDSCGLAWGVKQGMERIGVPSSVLRLGGGEGLITLLWSPGV